MLALAHYIIYCTFLAALRYGDSAGNTAEENSSIVSLIWMR